MKIIMNDKRINTVEKVKLFLDGSLELELIPCAMEDQLKWLSEKLKLFRYKTRRKREKAILKKYFMKMTSYSRSQLTRHIGRYLKGKSIYPKNRKGYKYPKKYMAKDIALLAYIDKLYKHPSGAILKNVMERMFRVYGEEKYKKISEVSVAYIYNLRRTTEYQRSGNWYKKTKGFKNSIGERKKPAPLGEPGFIRVDTVHQGDLNGEKGVYHINAVDEVTQWEVVATVPVISEEFMIPTLKEMLDQFPFKIKEFHSDNGSEFINYKVKKLLSNNLTKLSKSRPRRCNDNALVEGKNASVVRKHHGYHHISKFLATELNDFNQKFLNPFLNFHRPCYFPKDEVDKKGKIKKTYPYELVMTPFEKLMKIENVSTFLKKSTSILELKLREKLETDVESAQKLYSAKQHLFELKENKKSPLKTV